jgi:nucleotide-binding universal stress UspA family protein
MGQNVRRAGKIWVIAVDPFSDFDHKPVFEFAKQAAEQAGARLRAVYVLAPAALNWTGEFSGPWKKKYGPVAAAKLDEVLGTLNWEREVITCSDPSLKKAVRTLQAHARKLKADCILISTHARTGLRRMAMGSFAETLILDTKTPVIVIHPDKSVPRKVRKILVPTDLDKHSVKFIASIADYAKKIDAGIVLYYKQPDPLDPIVQQGVYSLGGGWVSVQSFIDEELQRKAKTIEKIEKRLRKKGIEVNHILDSGPGDLIEGIDKAAVSEGADMVSLRTEAGAWTSAILGSVARGLVRHGSLPLLVQR